MKPFKRCFSPWLRAKPDFIAAVPPRGIWIPGMLKYLLKTSAKIFGGSTMTYHRQFFSASIYIPSEHGMLTLCHGEKTDICKPRQWWCLALQTSYGVPKSPAADAQGKNQTWRHEVTFWPHTLHFGHFKASQSITISWSAMNYSCNDATRPYTLQSRQVRNSSPSFSLVKASWQLTRLDTAKL